MSLLDHLHAEAAEQPNSTRAWCQLALALESEGELERAKEALKRARAISPRDPLDWVEIAATSERLGEEQQAAAAYRRAVQIERRCIEAYLALGILLLRLGDTRAASLTLRVAVSHSPDSPELALLFARALQESGQVEDARAEAGRAAALRPDHAEPHRLLAKIHAQLGDPLGELDALRAAVMLEPEDYVTTVQLGRRLIANGLEYELEELFNRAIENAPFDFDAHLSLGSAMDELGLHELAVRCLKEAIRIRPNVADGHVKLGIALQAANNLHEAVVSLRTAVLIAPHNARANYQLGLALQRAGDIREAANALVKAQANAPDDKDIKAALSRIMAEKMKEQRAPLPRGSSESSMGSFGGDLSVFALPEMLEFLSTRRTSGTLAIVSEHGEGLIELHRGQLVRVTSPNRRTLLDILEENDMVTATDVKRALEGFGEQDENTVAAEKLIAKQVVDRNDVHDAKKKQMRAALEELVAWKEGEVTFHAAPKDLSAREEPELCVDTKWVLFEVMAALAERDA